MVFGMRNCQDCGSWISLEEISTHRCGLDVETVVDSMGQQKWPKILYSNVYKSIYKIEEKYMNINVICWGLFIGALIWAIVVH